MYLLSNTIDIYDWYSQLRPAIDMPDNDLPNIIPTNERKF